MNNFDTYIMENIEEAIRLDIKTDPEAVVRQAIFCGIVPGLRVLDAGCGSGKVTSILHGMLQPCGEITGIDYSASRISYAKEHFGNKSGIEFHVHDLMSPPAALGDFDMIWVRFFLEYFRKEGFDIVKNLSSVLKPGGCMCLIDLDYNCLNHYELPSRIEKQLIKIITRLEKKHNFDPYAGRKLYSFLYDLGYKDIKIDLMAHHLLYGEINEEVLFNWSKKVEIASKKTQDLFYDYPGGSEGFFMDYKNFFLDPRSFTYTPVIICKGSKPLAL
ncbi:MAG: methyltransferase domain-containing protein [Deltaproteobacteria bacterium]|nr:methyltransferase domain-containing protein [Deltaproteobacteria bacterium]